MNEATRAYSAAHFALELDGKQDVGLFKAVEGGDVKMDLIKYQDGGNHAPTLLRSGKPKYADIKVQVGMAMSRTFYDWITNFTRGNDDRRTGAIVAADFYFNERARREFAEAMITEVQFPKLDGNDKNACFMSVTLTPETVKYKPGTGNKIVQATGFDEQKLWAACNFDFVVDGFEAACRRVVKVDAFAIKMKPIDYQVGMRRETIKVMGRIEYPNLTFYIPEADAKAFTDYHQKTTANGELQADERLHGSINCYDNAQGLLFTVKYAGAEIFGVTHDKGDAASEDIKLAKIEMTVETMSFIYPAMEVASV
jgi:phage tail-like protein